jgi:hypothetical protein
MDSSPRTTNLEAIYLETIKRLKSLHTPRTGVFFNPKTPRPLPPSRRVSQIRIVELIELMRLIKVQKQRDLIEINKIKQDRAAHYTQLIDVLEPWFAQLKQQYLALQYKLANNQGLRTTLVKALLQDDQHNQALMLSQKHEPCLLAYIIAQYGLEEDRLLQTLFETLEGAEDHTPDIQSIRDCLPASLRNNPPSYTTLEALSSKDFGNPPPSAPLEEIDWSTVPVAVPVATPATTEHDPHVPRARAVPCSN